MRRRRAFGLALMIAVMTVIFLFSNQVGEQSQAVSNAVANSVNIKPQKQHVDGSGVPLLFGLTIRKWAHIGIFAVLGFAAAIWLNSWWRAMLVCYGYACLDELHQLYVAGRGANITDTFLDAAGFTAAIAVWLLVRRMKPGRNSGKDTRTA